MLSEAKHLIAVYHEWSPLFCVHHDEQLTQHDVYRCHKRYRAARPTDAIAKEKQLKGWKRIRENELVRAANPEWKDLASEDSSW